MPSVQKDFNCFHRYMGFYIYLFFFFSELTFNIQGEQLGFQSRAGVQAYFYLFFSMTNFLWVFVVLISCPPHSWPLWPAELGESKFITQMQEAGMQAGAGFSWSQFNTLLDSTNCPQDATILLVILPLSPALCSGPLGPWSTSKDLSTGAGHQPPLVL
jgi:hypothetical protein